jgi:5'-3' exonuclease
MTGKYTLIFDGNFWLHKTYFIGQRIKQGKPFNFIDEPEADKNLLLWKLSIDFAAEVKRFEGVVNRIVYTIDSSSWRKKLLDQEYKANRKKSSDINWNEIYNVHNEFVKSLESLGVIVSRIQGAEADDLIYAWSSLLNQNGQNSMIISGDNDLLQLVNHDKSSGANTLYYNKFDKDLHVFQGFESWLYQEDYATTHDIFNMPIDLISNSKQHLRDIVKANRMQIDEVNINEFIFRKILIGDAGDNVSPLETKIKESKNGPRVYRVSDKQANDILSEFKKDKMFVNQSHLFNDEQIEQICHIAKRVIKIEKPINEIVDKWKLNRDLVFLHKECIPTEVYSSMFDSIESEWKKSLSASNVQSVMDKESILKGTTYSKEKKDSFAESNVFKVLKTENPESEVKIKKETDSSFDTNFWDSLIK